MFSATRFRLDPFHNKSFVGIECRISMLGIIIKDSDEFISLCTIRHIKVTFPVSDVRCIIEPAVTCINSCLTYRARRHLIQQYEAIADDPCHFLSK